MGSPREEPADLVTVRRHDTHSWSRYVKTKLRPSSVQHVSEKGRQSLGKIQQKISGLPPVTTLSDKGMGQSISPVPRPVLHHIVPSKVMPCLVATRAVRPHIYLNPFCPGIWGGGATTLPMSILAGKGTCKHEVYFLYASPKNPNLYSNPPLLSALCGAPVRRVAGADPAPHPAGPQKVVAHFPVTGLSRCEMLHIAARLGALGSVLEEAPEISLVGRKNTLWIPCLGFCFVFKENSRGQGGRGLLCTLLRGRKVTPGIANNYLRVKQRVTGKCYLQQNLNLPVVTDNRPGEQADRWQQHVRVLYYKCSCLLQINPNCQLTSVRSTRCCRSSRSISLSGYHGHSAQKVLLFQFSWF